MKKIIKLFSIVLLIGGMFSFGLIIKPNHTVKNKQAFKWEKLGSRKVNMGADHDEILVTAYAGFFSKIKFKVLDAPILLRNVKIVFGNGESRNVKVNKKFTAGMESRVIDLPGNTRIIKKIVMNYTAVAKHKGKATFVVWGRH
tara:strand:+ start:144 stop:572 length:429 start_codon:yes stop_codon:yes gene_type:complete